MFGRKRHAAPEKAPVTPRLTEDRIFELVHEHVAAFLGENGSWTLTRRGPEDTDVIFQGAIARSLSAQITATIQTAQHRLETGAEAHESAHVAEAPDEATDPAASVESTESSEWAPAPITRWADLRRPVTGEIPQVDGDSGPDRALVA